MFFLSLNTTNSIMSILKIVEKPFFSKDLIFVTTALKRQIFEI